MAVSDALIATAQESNRSWRIEKSIARLGLGGFFRSTKASSRCAQLIFQDLQIGGQYKFSGDKF